jgi:hypothetical protein
MTKKDKKNKKSSDEEEDLNNEEEECGSSESSESSEEDDYEVSSSEEEKKKTKKSAPKNSKGSDKKKAASTSSKKEKDTPAASKGKSKAGEAKKMGAIPPPAPHGTTITSNPFDESNQIPIQIPIMVSFDPTERKKEGFYRVDILPHIREALSNQHLQTYDKMNNKYVKLDPSNLHYFFCSGTVSGAWENSFPYPLAVFVDLPTSNHMNLHLEKSLALTEPSQKESAKKWNRCSFVVPRELSATSVGHRFWHYNPKNDINSKIDKWGNLMSGASTMWKDSEKVKNGKFLVSSDSPGIQLLKGKVDNSVQESKEFPGYSYVSEEDKNLVDKDWLNSKKSWGVLDTFSIKDDKPIYIYIFRADVHNKDERVENNYWSNLDNTAYAKADSISSNDVIKKIHTFTSTIKLQIGAPQ